MVSIQYFRKRSMTYILRMFFYSIGLALLLAVLALDPTKAQFKDLVALIHTFSFWQIVGLSTAMLIGAELVFSGKWSATVDAAFNVAKRFRDARKSASAH